MSELEVLRARCSSPRDARGREQAPDRESGTEPRAPQSSARYAETAGGSGIGALSHPGGKDGARQAGSGRNDVQPSSHHRSPRSSIAPTSRPEAVYRVALLLGVAALADAILEQLLVLEAPGAVDRDPDVELEVLRVVADRGPSERLLEVQVPACEAALRPVPEVPDRVRLARSSQREDAVAFPGALSRPRVRTAVGARRKGERRLLRQVRDEQLGRILDDHDRRRAPGHAAPHLAVDDHVASPPRHAATVPRVGSVPGTDFCHRERLIRRQGSRRLARSAFEPGTCFVRHVRGTLRSVPDQRSQPRRRLDASTLRLHDGPARDSERAAERGRRRARFPSSRSS